MATQFDAKHSDWLTVGEALRLAKPVLAKFIAPLVTKWHEGLRKQLHDKEKCQERHGPDELRCNAQKNSDLWCTSCTAWKQEIKKVHKGTNVSWKNADCTMWAEPEGSWEVAKVFMATLGPMKAKVVDVETTDIASLLCLLRFLPDNAFPGEQPVTRLTIDAVSTAARNPWAHAPRQEMETDDKNCALDALEALLNDDALRPSVGNQIQELQKLKTNGVTNISISEMRCFALLTNEISAQTSDLAILTKTSSGHDQQIKDLQREIGNVLSLVNGVALVNRDEEMRSEFQILKKELTDALKVKQKELEKQLKKQLENTNAKLDEKTDLTSCGLPDYQKNVFGRGKDIARVIELIQDEKKPCVVLTGGPGFGKSTTAIQAAYGINNKVIFFVRLRGLCSIQHVCREVLSIVVGRRTKDEEEMELMHWARSLEKEVILILDNAEDILNAKDSVRDQFCGLLQKLRDVSRRNMQFVVTSRERFQVEEMEVVCHEIGKLSNEEGVEVLRSLTSKTNLNADDVEEIANLCGGIPLALRLTGSIIDYFDVEVLMKGLQNDPMELLEDNMLPSYHRSLRAAFECSFKWLNESQKEKLVCLSVFRGSFEEPAVTCIWNERTSVTVKILKEFTEKSLLQKRSLAVAKYELHPLVQKYLKDKKLYKVHIENATDKFIEYYMSRIMKGNEMFWSKDKFMKSIAMCKADDSLNIDETLEICYKNAEKVGDCLSNLWSVTIYLEMIISFENLIKFLQSCLRSAEDQNQEGAAMEAHCLIAYYQWKKGASRQHKTHMDKAKTLYERADTSMSSSQLWFFKHSYGLFLDQQRHYHEAWEITMDAMQLAESFPDNTDLALTLSQLGIIEKHRHHFEEAETWLTKSFKKRLERLGGKHILSVPKHPADLYLQQKKYKEALKLYEKGYATFTSLKMHDGKQCMYLLKNMGACYRLLRQTKEAEESYQKSIETSERLLDGDYKFKVLLSSEMAILHNQSPGTAGDSTETAYKFAKDAIEMAKRLRLKQWYLRKEMEKIVMVCDHGS